MTDNSNKQQTGIDLLSSPINNKGTGFTDEERDKLGLRGLLPPRVSALTDQVARVMANYRRKSSDIERYLHLMNLQSRNETLFYRVIVEHMEELMPIIYTPTVGEACRLYGHLYEHPKGLYITSEDADRIPEILGNWPESDVRIIVVTDGERILGLGDLGTNGMGIPVGKLSLYTACAGVHPRQCLPIVLDVGTENQKLLDDPFYLGLRQHRVTGEVYDRLLDRFVESVQQVFPNALIQFEDFANHNAFRLLERYRNSACTFNDDIQGTGSVALAGLLAAPKLAGKEFTAQRFLFMGAGEAGLGIGDMIVGALCDSGLSLEEARGRCWFMDKEGLVVASRDDLTDHKINYAHDHAPKKDLLEVVKSIRPTVLIGVCGQPGVFTKPVVEEMTRINARPIIMALSNPTSKAECTARDAYNWSQGKAIFASGSPFGMVEFNGQQFRPGQGNNAYIFPGVGLGVIVSGARHVTDEMFFAAARTLANRVSEQDMAVGRIYPPLGTIREVSAEIAYQVAEIAFNQGLASTERPADLEQSIQDYMYKPEYN